MKILSILIEDIRGFTGENIINVSESINVFIGKNNAGKSTILKSLYALQQHEALSLDDITFDRDYGRLYARIKSEGFKFRGNGIPPGEIRFTIRASNGEKTHHYTDESGTNRAYNSGELNHNEYNFIYPYLSKRKVLFYEEEINRNNSRLISENLTYLYAKLDNVLNSPNDEISDYFKESCHKVLGFQIKTKITDKGKKAIYFINDMYDIPLPAMGEGVANIIGLIVDMVISKGKIFIIEELENDIHPQALKALLSLIVENSTVNQFFISTHSNIVMKVLGAVKDAKVFKVSNEEFDRKLVRMRLSSCEELLTAVDRRNALEELGYDFFDYDLWKGWLILEESSAQTIIDFLIKWFCPGLLNKLKVVSAGGVDKVSSKFNAITDLFLFLHLEEMYKNRAWVIVDGGDKEKNLIDEFKRHFVKNDGSGWDNETFSQFSEHDFESYYPDTFKAEREKIFQIADKGKKKLEKSNLIKKVVAWISENEMAAKNEFERSAVEVIEKLKMIERNLNG